MIPYDDLVVALQTWRARQGLPVAQLGAPSAAADSGSTAAPRTNPPAAPPKAAAPPPLAPPDEDVDDAGLLVEEAHYENEGDDFAMAFGQPAEPDSESTSIGSPPPATSPARDSFGGSTEPEPPAKPNRDDDW